MSSASGAAPALPVRSHRHDAQERDWRYAMSPALLPAVRVSPSRPRGLPLRLFALAGVLCSLHAWAAPPERCGNGRVEPNRGEVCDDGNTVSGDGCSADCRSLEYCGNGVVDRTRGEVCDDGNTQSGDGCSSDCHSLETCGNGIVDSAAGEQCDDGNTTNSDACLNTCVANRCGDGFRDVESEPCDDGNNVNTDACTNRCTIPFCGDSITSAGEQCDDGNFVNTDACTNSCTVNCAGPL
ncbi:DUF4215 domain-containing protein [Aggregicoccus sp. 17bor-14]|nr:DUF4215 domain-containing protein [Aggregicoccus sp. 17bor-14]